MANKHVLDLIRKRFDTQGQFCAAAGWPTSKLSKLLSEKQPWKDDDLLTASRLLGCSMPTLFRLIHGTEVAGTQDEDSYTIRSFGPNPVDRSPDVATWVDKAVWVFPEHAMVQWGIAEGEAENEFKIIMIRGYSMTPLYNPGDYVMVKTSVDMGSLGEYAVNLGGSMDFRIVSRDANDPSMLKLMCANKEYPSETVPWSPGLIVGRVVAHMRRR